MGDPDASDDVPSFDIPHRPTRRYPRRGGVEYEGETVFRLDPGREPPDGSLSTVVEAILQQEPYRYGDWFELPMPLYLVHDDETNDTFRVAVRDNTVELHVLPATEPAGLRAFYRRLTATFEADWSVECQVGSP